ncbi:unnamed protein product [Cercospora beticola]|nr:unnamed protein product [Cercospora beticola]
MNSLLRHAIVFLWVAAALGRAQSTGYDSNTDSVPKTTQAPYTGSAISSTLGLHFTNSTGTCPSRTVNYITHTLARQCLRTDRAPSNGTQHILTTTDHTGTFATTLITDERPQVATVTYTVANGTTTILGEHTSSARHEPSPAHASNSPTASDANVAASTASLSVEEEESDSALDNANFLSFEDWKKQNLAKSGQSPDDVGRTQTTNAHRPRPVNNALDTLGDEQEIDIDFVGFGGVSQSAMPESPTAQTEAAQTPVPGHPTSLRSKDAGKTCKERTNYASFDCAATVLKNNKEAKSATSVLVESKDSYMLNKCAADNKFLIVELCNDIQIDTIVLANYEFFSSGFRHFRLSVSDRYPVKMEKWRDLGTFEARNTREIQAFLIENPQIWARYLRIEFLTHYGSEYYCPVSLLRVHGITMMEDYRHQEELARGEIDDVTLDTEVLATPPIHQEPVESTDEASKATEQAIPPVVPGEPDSVSSQEKPQKDESCSSCTSNEATMSSTEALASSLAEKYDNASFPMAVGVYEPTNANMTCDQRPTSEVVTSSNANLTALPQTGSTSSFTSTSSSISDAASTITPTVTKQNVDTEVAINSSSTSHDSSAREEPISATVLPANSTSNSTTGPSSSTYSASGNQTAAASNSTRPVASSASSPPPAQPSTQESFFKQVHKRLQQLESNSTLSLQYIEEQSRILREAFSKVEKRQVATTSKFLSHLNETVMAELHGFRQAYDQLWQSTVIELEGQRETYQREMLALSSRLTMVADELVWQKRMGIVQSTLLLMCLALVLFGRSSNGALEVPLMQQLLNKSTTALSGWDTPPLSPSPESRSPVSLFRRKLWRSSTAPADSQYASDDGGPGGVDSSRPVTREGRPQPEISVEAPSPPRGSGAEAQTDEWEDEDGQVQEGRLSLDSIGSARVSVPSGPSGSPGRKRKKGKKFTSGLEGVMRFGNGIRSTGQDRPKSPLANGDWQQ